MSDASRDETTAAAGTETAAAAATETPATAAPEATEAAASPETTNSETAAAAPESPASLLAEAGDKPAPETTEAKPPEGEKPADAKAPEADAKKDAAKPGESAPAQTEAPAEAPPAPTYEPFALPEGFTPDTERMTKLTEALGQLETTGKVDHALVQQFGQNLINLHTEEVSRAVDTIRQQQFDAWKDTNQRWQDEVKSDPVIGGNRLDTAMQVCGSVIEEFGGARDPKTGEVNKDEVKTLRQALIATGAGNHPAIVRFVHRIGEALGEGRPVPASKPVPEKMRPADKMYTAKRQTA